MIYFSDHPAFVYLLNHPIKKTIESCLFMNLLEYLGIGEFLWS